MTEKIDLGNNPFGAFFGANTEDPTEVKEDALSELMQLDAAPPSTFTVKAPAVFPTPAEASPEPDPTPTPAPAAPRAPEIPPPVAKAPEPELSAVGLGETLAAPSPSATAQFEAPRIAAAPQAQTVVEETTRAAQPAAAPAELFVARPPEPIDQRKLWLLRILLASNLAMMLVMLLMPHPMETRTEYVRGGSSTSGEEGVPRIGRSGQGTAPARSAPEPFVQPARPQSLGLPDDPNYEKALLQALEGDFTGATGTLRAFLAAHPGLDPALERLVHAHLAYYLRKSGELGDAIVHEGKARQMSGRAFLPEELLRSAREAEIRGDGDGMRRAYAQFLLQEDQLPPALRALVQEAYLKLGDAYRVEAERAEQAALRTPAAPGPAPGGTGK